jgi:hypothetical protein
MILLWIPWTNSSVLVLLNYEKYNLQPLTAIWEVDQLAKGVVTPPSSILSKPERIFIGFIPGVQELVGVDPLTPAWGFVRNTAAHHAFSCTPGGKRSLHQVYKNW